MLIYHVPTECSQSLLSFVSFEYLHVYDVDPYTDSRRRRRTLTDLSRAFVPPVGRSSRENRVYAYRSNRAISSSVTVVTGGFFLSRVRTPEKSKNRKLSREKPKKNPLLEIIIDRDESDGLFVRVGYVSVFRVAVHVRILPEQPVDAEGVQFDRAVWRMHRRRSPRPARGLYNLLVESVHPVYHTGRVDNIGR